MKQSASTRTLEEADVDEVSAGSVLIVEGNAHVEKVSSGAVVVADMVYGLEEVSSGGTVVCNNAAHIDVWTHSGGSLHDSLEGWLTVLYRELSTAGGLSDELIEEDISLAEDLRERDFLE